ncbi:membrane protein [Bordetella pseudohinzii]|nr:membrane protein [Bordetella pseudohinzii]
MAAAVAGSLLAQPPLLVLAQGAPTLAPARAAESVQAAESGSAWSRKLAGEMQSMAVRQGERQAGAHLDGDYLKRQAQSQFNDVLQSGVDAARQSGLPFLRQLQGGLNHDFESGRTSVELKTIDELHRDGADTVLLQLGAHNQNDRPTANVGAVYRREVNDGLMLGANGFLDYEFGKQHLRGSVGVEAIAPEFSLYGNVYAPISGWKAAKRDDRRQERPASGVDVGGKYRPAWAPGLSLSAAYFRWNGANVDYYDNGRVQDRATGFKYGIEYRPVPLIGLGVEQTKVIGGGRETRVQLGLSINLSEPLSKQLQRDTSGAPAFSLDAQRHALVERENRIVLNTRRKEIILPLSVTQLSTHPIDGRVTVIGLTQPRATVALRMPDGSSGSATADAAGRYTYTSATDQPSGSIVLRASNAQGDQSRELTRPYVDEVVLGDMQVVVLAMAPQPADRALMLSGRTEPGMDVMVHFPNGESVAAKSDAEGLFHTRSLRAVGQGEVMVRAIDPQTRKEARAAALYVPPAVVAPTIDKMTTDAASGRLTVQGQAEPGSELELVFPDGSRQRTRIGADGRYELTSAADVPSGQVRALRVPGPGEEEVSASRPYVDATDKTPPAAPVLVSAVPAADTGRVTVTGKTEPGATVELVFPDGSRERVVAGEDGGFRATSENDIPSGPIRAGATDAAGNQGPQAVLDYADTVDKTAPAAPTIVSAVAAAATGRVTVVGKAEPHADVEVVFPDGSIERARADAGGNYRATSAGDIESGLIKAAAIDAAGNRGPQATHAYVDTVDKTAPGAPSIDQVQTRADNGQVTVAGMAEPHASVTVTFPGGGAVTVPAGADGRYRAESPGDIASGRIIAQAADAAGNRSPRTERPYVDAVDKTAPGAPTIVSAVAEPATGRVTVVGRTEPDVLVEVVFPDNSIQRTRADAGGNYRATSARDIESGPIKAAATDAAGNRSPQTTHAYVDTVDKTAPAAPSIVTAVADPGNGRVTVRGQAEAGVTVTVRFPDGTSKAVTADGSGGYTATSDRDIDSGDITAQAADRAGNTSGVTTHAYHDSVDATPPGAPSITAATADPASGRVTVTGRAEAGVTVTLRFPDGTSKTTTAAGDGSYRATSDRDIDSGDITAQAADRAGNKSGVTTHAYQDRVDVTPPAAPVISGVTTDSRTGRVTVSGRAEPRVDVTVVFTDGTRQRVKARADGGFDATSVNDIPSGTLMATATDAAGNQSPPARRAYADTVDKTPPGPPTIDRLDTNPSNGLVTASGKAEPLALVEVVFSDGSKQSARADRGGRYAVTSARDIGSGDIRAVARDDAGNASAPAVRRYDDSWTPTLPPSAVLFEIPSRQYLSITKSPNAGGRLWMLYLDPKYAGKVQVSVRAVNASNANAQVVARYVESNIEQTVRFDPFKQRDVFAIGFHDQMQGNKPVAKVPSGRYPNLLEVRVTIPGEGVYHLKLNVGLYD